MPHHYINSKSLFRLSVPLLVSLILVRNFHRKKMAALGPHPQRMTCPSCHAQITTAVEVESSTKTHLIALVLCLVFFPCVCVPYCTDSCKSKNHYCPQCHAYIGHYDS